MLHLPLVCSILGHRRSSKHAKFDREHFCWRSICVYCGIPLERVAHKDWRPKSKSRHSTSPNHNR